MEEDSLDKYGSSNPNNTQSETCPFCEAIVTRDSKFCLKCGSKINNSFGTESTQTIEKQDNTLSKKRRPLNINETKCTCNSCGNIYYYGKEEVLEKTVNSLDNASKELAAASCCYCNPFINATKTKNDITDYNKCPKCGSRNIIKEKIKHEI